MEKRSSRKNIELHTAITEISIRKKNGSTELDLNELAGAHRRPKLIGARFSRALKLCRFSLEVLASGRCASRGPGVMLAAPVAVPWETKRAELPPLPGRRRRSTPPPRPAPRRPPCPVPPVLHTLSLTLAWLWIYLCFVWWCKKFRETFSKL
jgi:hypothetical protein